VIAPTLIVFLSLKYGWRSAFLVASVSGLLWVPLWLYATSDHSDVPRIQDAGEIWGVRQRLSSLANKRVLSYVLTGFFGDSSGYFFLFWLPEYLMSSKNFTFTMLGTLGWIPFFWNDIGGRT